MSRLIPIALAAAVGFAAVAPAFAQGAAAGPGGLERRVRQLESSVATLQQAKVTVGPGGGAKSRDVRSPNGRSHDEHLKAACPAGQAIVAIEVHTGGTCNNQCGGDGNPVGQVEISCGTPGLTH